MFKTSGEPCPVTGAPDNEEIARRIKHIKYLRGPNLV